ncbi:MAG TPA: TetR/AcrR family transcriptional regulator [Streptosporangiaceae bacterium]|nr:TetR/AcrR family transcriptional regulator [Streptosporangiaceae bacterium]
MPSTGRGAAPGAAPARSAGRRRADAERNIEAILDAARACFRRGPAPSMTEIARTAGVGRVTLYGHFPSREALLEAVLERTLQQANAALESVDVDSGPADEALARLIGSSWRIVDEHRNQLAAALEHLGPDRVRDRHADALARVERLIARGQAAGVFAQDVPLGWLVTTFYTLMHAAAQEADQGNLSPEIAPGVLTRTLLGALSAGPGHRPT